MFVEKLGNGIYDVSHAALDRPREQFYYKHMHPYCELLLMIEGDVDFHIGGDQYHLQPYDLLLIPKETYHYLHLCSITRYENYVIDFYDTLLPPGKPEKLFQPSAVFNIGEDEELLRLFGRFDAYHSTYDHRDFCSCAECLVREILTYCCYAPRLPAAVMKPRSTLIRNILRYVDEHLQESLDADILADHLNISRSHIQNVFSEDMQIGLKQYITQKKILAAHNDLTRGLSATGAAEKYRFHDYSTFFRLYKKTFGRAPSAARKSGSQQ